MIRITLLFALSIAAIRTALAVPQLALPIACPATGACFIQNYVDHDAGAGFRDYRCGPLAYDAHKGTDIRVRDLATLSRGVAVLAAAAGRVVKVRDGFPERSLDELQDRESLPQDGGNEVAIEHENGWITRYAHLRPGSIVVKPGQLVEKGSRLALMGLSGRTEFPHLHFELRHNGRVVDPFAPAWIGCVALSGGLWEEPSNEVLIYRSPFVIGRGFAERAPTAATILRDSCLPEGGLPEDPVALIFWSQFSGIAVNETVTVRLRSPDGQVISQTTSLQKQSKAVWLAYSGIRRPDDGWPPGVYRGEWLVIRSGAEVMVGEENVCINPGRLKAGCVREEPSCVTP